MKVLLRKSEAAASLRMGSIIGTGFGISVQDAS